MRGSFGFRNKAAFSAARDIMRPAYRLDLQLPKAFCTLFKANPQVDFSKFQPVDLWIAWSTCRATRRRWLIADPLGYPEIEPTEFPKLSTNGWGQTVEADFQIKPKQGGGLRLEVLPDIFTSTYFQAVADRLAERDLGLASSLSARLFGLRLKQGNPYEVWSSVVPAWIRTELASGHCVVFADIHDYFGSIKLEQIEAALRRAGLEEEIWRSTIALVDALNKTPDEQGAIRSGLPVVPEEFFWLVADLVLAPVDEALDGILPFSAYARWVDDFLVATALSDVDPVLARLQFEVETRGFRLNPTKTKVFTSLEEFENVSRLTEHKILDDLFLTQVQGSISNEQQTALDRLIRSQRTTSPEDGRLWKRIYGLAERLRTPLLLERAIADLDRLPLAELQILAYLSALGWPNLTATQALGSISKVKSQTRALGTLRALVSSSSGPSAKVKQILQSFLLEPDSDCHPFVCVLAFACLIRDSDPGELLFEGQQLLERLPRLASATARRVAIELLWLIPHLRPELSKQIALDQSWEVKCLQSLANADRADKQRMYRFERRATPPRSLDWGEVDLRIARAFHLVYT